MIKWTLPRRAAASALVAALLPTAVAAAAQQHRAPSRGSGAARTATPAAAAVYACPMHPEVTAKRAGKTCPKCNMKLVKAEARTAPETPAPGPAKEAAAAAVEESAAPIPDTVVYDQDGRRLNFYTDLVRGRTVAVNFIFTTCTGVCPTLTAKFRQLRQQLDARRTDARLISISVDPVTDVPERLKEYARKFKAGEGWTFVTGGKPEIDALLAALGSAAPTKTDHTSTALIINDPAGYRTRASALTPASTLADLVVEAAAKRPAPAPAAAGAEAERRRTAEASASYFPNHTLVTHDGRRVRFYDDLLRGRVVLINFMFTTCAGVCSPMTANLAKVQSYLGERVGRDVWMLSITVDPATDTPEAMRAYAAKHKAGPGWYFLSGEKQNVDWVLYKLGGYTEDKAAHSGVLIIGNEATGQWMKVHAMSKPSQIAEAVVRLAAGESVGAAR